MTSSDTPADVRAVALTTYRAMWADMVEAGKTADYQSPAMAHHAASQALQLLVSALYEVHKDNAVIKGEPTFDPQVTSVTTPDHPVAVGITDCVDGRRWLNYTADGKLKDPPPTGRRRAMATVGLLDGVWKVTRLQVQGIGTC